MVTRLFISFVFLVVASFGVAAKTITLNKLDISKNPALEKILKTVSEEGDSVVPGKKYFTVSPKEHQGGLYLYIGLIEGRSLQVFDWRKLPKASDYIGFLYVDKNLFFIKNRAKIDSIIKTQSKRQFPVEFVFPDFDGVVYWEYYILNDEIHRLDFKSAW